jgi:hypothetical protein
MSPSVPNELSDRLARQLAGRCVYPGCEHDSADGSDYCLDHRTRARARDLVYRTRQRAARRQKGQCAMCGRKSKRYRCPACYRNRVGVRNKAKGVDKARGRIVHEDRSKYGWAPTARYVGRSRRGAPSLEDRARDWLIDLADVTKRVEAQREAIETALREGVFAWPKVQRDQAMRIAATQGAIGARMLSGVVLALDPEADVVAAEEDK